jgi:hypothetical protein
VPVSGAVDGNDNSTTTPVNGLTNDGFGSSNPDPNANAGGTGASNGSTGHSAGQGSQGSRSASGGNQGSGSSSGADSSGGSCCDGNQASQSSTNNSGEAQSRATAAADHTNTTIFQYVSSSFEHMWHHA